MGGFSQNYKLTDTCPVAIGQAVNLASYPNPNLGNAVFLPVGQEVSRNQYPTLSAAFPASTYFNVVQRTFPYSYLWQYPFYGGPAGNGKFMLSSGGGSTSLLTYSTDCINWSSANFTQISGWTGFAYTNGVFVGGAFNTTLAQSSQDGVSWTARTFPRQQNWTNYAGGNGNFVAINASGTQYAASSSDGYTWTERTLPSSASWNFPVYGNGTFLVTANGPSTKAATSSNGVTWAPQTMPANLGWSASTFGNGKFVVVAGGSTTNVCAVSSDGISWATGTLPSAATWMNVGYGNGVFVATSSTNLAAMSIDGITWTAYTLPISPSTNWCSGLPYGGFAGGGVFFLAMYNSATYLTIQAGMSGSSKIYLSGPVGSYVRVA
jgi:hypothetical protein